VLLQGRLCPGAHAGIVDENIDASEFRQKAIDIIGLVRSPVWPVAVWPAAFRSFTRSNTRSVVADSATVHPASARNLAQAKPIPSLPPRL
jgi:hypothetical protein